MPDFATITAGRKKTDGWLLRFGPWLVGAAAILYYGQFYQAGLNLGGEGGTTAVLAMRLLEGQRPFVDSYMGYNLMWFYPVVALFKVLGPSFLALRIYFFALATLAAILGFLIVRRVTRQGWLALGVGLLIVAIPGAQFRNYMSLLPLLNAWVLLHAFVHAPRPGSSRGMIAAGAVLGLTLLTRAELGLFFLIIYAGLILLLPFTFAGTFFRRIRAAAIAGALCLASVAAVHLPFYLDARHRGFADAFLEQYSTSLEIILQSSRNQFSAGGSARTPPTAAGENAPPEWTRAAYRKIALAPTPAAPLEEEKRRALLRPPVSSVFAPGDFSQSAFVAALYLPIVVGVIIVLGAGAILSRALIAHDPAPGKAALACLVTLGAALTIFPQYFFFRPDLPHLSEFMVPYLVAMVCASFHAARWMTASASRTVRAAAAAFILLCVVDETVYVFQAWPRDLAGTISTGRKRTQMFRGENGVTAYVRAKDQPWLQALHDTIVHYSTPAEWVVVYAYAPTINFMTNRRSYLYNLYVDNVTAPGNFLERTREEIHRFHPAIIVVNNRAINKTEYSRFKNWAANTYEFIRRSYVLVGTFDENEVYVRRNKIPPRT